MNMKKLVTVAIVFFIIAVNLFATNYYVGKPEGPDVLILELRDVKKNSKFIGDTGLPEADFQLQLSVGPGNTTKLDSMIPYVEVTIKSLINDVKNIYISPTNPDGFIRLDPKPVKTGKGTDGYIAVIDKAGDFMIDVYFSTNLFDANKQMGGDSGKEVFYHTTYKISSKPAPGFDFAWANPDKPLEPGKSSNFKMEVQDKSKTMDVNGMIISIVDPKTHEIVGYAEKTNPTNAKVPVTVDKSGNYDVYEYFVMKDKSVQLHQDKIEVR